MPISLTSSMVVIYFDNVVSGNVNRLSASIIDKPTSKLALLPLPKTPSCICHIEPSVSRLSRLYLSLKALVSILLYLHQALRFSGKYI
jgi:hypothetical protein